MSRLQLSTELATELDYFRLLRRQNAITKAQFERQKKKIINRQEELDEIDRQRRLQAEFLRKEAERKKKAQEKRIAKNVIFRRTISSNPIADIIDAWKATQNIQMMRAITPDRDFQIFSTKQSKDFVRQFFEGGVSDAELVLDEGDQLLIVRPSKIPAKKLRQMFRDGISHCVFTPLITKLNKSISSSESPITRKKYIQRINRLKKLELLYEKGVPEDNMEEVAKASGFKIIIQDVIGNSMMVLNENGRLGTLKFTNTRPNHIELGSITLDCDFEIISEKEIITIWKNARKTKTFYNIEGDIKNGLPRRLHLLDKAYRVKDPNEEYFDAMNERIDLNRYKFNASKYPEVNEFIKAGRLINSWVCPFTDEKPTGHLDMPKAYTQFKKCDWYSGFMGVIHQWRSGSFDRAFINKHIGIYRFKVLKCENGLFQKLGIVQDSIHILPSPEIIYFMDKGLEVSIDAGVWGSRFDFEFSDEMLEDRRYCLWSGRLGMERTTRNFSFHCEADWASHYKAQYGDNCFYWADEKICSIRVPIPNVMTTHHIFAFITSYVRIQMMEAMNKFKLDQIVKVLLDGIYFIGEKPMGLEWFKEKEIVEQNRVGFQWYSDAIIDFDFPSIIVENNTLMTGQGGAGKTYKIMTDNGFNKILFVTPQHILGTNVKKAYDKSYTTIHKLIGQECQPYLLDHAYPPVIFCDEITQIESSWIDRMMSMYKDSLIIMAGDLNAKGQWFQCRNGRPGEFSSIWKPTIDVLHIDGDRRSRDDTLRDLKLKVRAVMEKIFVDGDSGEDIVIQRWARKNLKSISFDDAVKMFESGDRWIAGTHKTSDKLLANGIVSGWYKQGGFVEFEEKEGYIKRGSFTIHSFQGRTLESGKIFISIGDLFEYAMLYTAISRAVNFDQLVFVA